MTPSDMVMEHYQRPEVKAAILSLCEYGGGLRPLNGGDFWYVHKDGKMRLRGPADFDDTVSRERSLYMLADVFTPEVFGQWERRIEGRGGEIKPEHPIGTRADLIAYSLFADVDAVKDPADEGDEDGKPRSKLYHKGRIEALEAAASFMVRYLKDRGISEAVGVLFSGQGVYVWLHPALSNMSEVRALADFDRDQLDKTFKIWFIAFNDLLADIEKAFFEAFPEHVGRVKFDKLNHIKRKVKCLLSIHRTLPFAVVPLDKDDIRIDLEAARVPLSDETVARARSWLNTWRAGEGERSALVKLLKPYSTKAAEDVTVRAKTSGEIRRASEPVPVESWCPFYRGLLEFPGGAGGHRVCGALATWLYQAAWPEEEAFQLWGAVADRCEVETRIFYTSYGVINSPNCETIQRTSAGYPSLGFGGMGLCRPDETCKGCHWPGDYGTTSTDAARDLLETVRDGLIEDPRKLKDRDVLAALLTLRARDPLEFDLLANELRDAGVVKLPTLKKMIDGEERRAEEKTKNRTTDDDGDEGFSLLDFCYITDEGKYVFSPTTATKSIIAKATLAMTATETDIYRFDGQIYCNDGDRKIDLNLCHVAKDHVLGKNVQEVIRRVKNELLEDPVVFDGNPYLLGVRNGVVDLRTGEFRDYRPEDLITYQIDVTHDPAARCPRYVQFLEEVQPNVTDRLTLVDWFPATAIRRPLPYVLFLLGLGRNGKGIYERLIKRFFGASAFRDMALSEVTKNNFAAGNFYKKLGWIATEQSGKKKATIGTDFIKLVTGEGSIDADRKNLSRIQFDPYFQTTVDTNAMPKIEDTSVGWLERFCKQDLPYVFVSNPDPKNPLEKKKDPHLLRKLTTDEELSGILNLLIWRATEICKTETITKRPASELFNEYSQQSASVSTFCDQFLEYEEGLTEPNIPTADIYQAYKKWCSYLVGEVVDEAYFGRYLRRLCGNRQPSRPRRGNQRLTAYPGLLFHEDKVRIAIEAFSKGWTGMDGHGQVVDEKDFSKTDNKRTGGTSGQVELWNQIVKRFGPCRPEVQEDKEEDFLSKEENRKNTRPTRPLVPPIAGDPKNGKSTRPLPVHTGPLPVQGEDERELAGEIPEPSDDYQTIAEELAEDERRKALEAERTATPSPKADEGERPSMSFAGFKEIFQRRELEEITAPIFAKEQGITPVAAKIQLDRAAKSYGLTKRRVGLDDYYRLPGEVVA